MNRPSGLTLFEAMLTLFLIGLTLILSASTLQGALRMTTQAQSSEASVRGLAVLETMRRELCESTTVTQPTGGNDTTTLTFRKIDPNAVGRIPQTPVAWTPNSLQDNLTISYTQSGNGLSRSVTNFQNDSSSEVVAEQVESFSVRQPSPGLLELNLSFTRGQTLLVYRTMVRRLLR